MQFLFLYFRFIKMFQKENQQNKLAFLRKDRRGVASKVTGQANDFVLKRYQLEQNKLFKQKHNEDLRYEVRNNKDVKEDEEEIEDEFVIVPLELSRCKQAQNCQQREPQKKQEAQQIFVFDDDEDIHEEHIQSSTYSKQNTSFACQQNTPISSPNNSQLMSAKHSSRDNCSAAELMTPKLKTFNKKETNPNEALEKICKDQIQRPKIHQQQSEEGGIQNLKGVKIGNQSANKSISITITDKKLFNISKLPSGIILKCIIKRTSSILNMMSPEFDLYLANGLKHIVSAKKYPLRNRQLFKFSINPLKFDIQNIIGVMHANVKHNLYWLLDLPRRVGDMDLSLIYLVVGYYKLVNEKEQRKFTTLLPPNSNSEYQLGISYEINNINFSNIKEEIDTEICNLTKWKDQNFNSTKNFVLADEDDPDYHYLEMKKETDDVFQLTIQHPFCPLQAMAIAMTRFDVQLK